MPTPAEVNLLLSRLETLAAFGYWQGGKDSARDAIDCIIDLDTEAQQKDAWERRYNTLLTLCEQARPKPGSPTDQEEK